MSRSPQFRSGSRSGTRSVTIRPATPADAVRLAEIASAAYAPYVAEIGREPPPMLQDFPADISDGAVWVRDDPPTGYVVARPKGEDWLIENVAVAPEAQGRGIGRALIAFAEAEGARRGFVRATLYTNAAMRRNMALYPSLGYAEMERRQVGDLHRVYYAKALTS